MKKFIVKFLNTDMQLESDNPEKVKHFAQSITEQVLEIKRKRPAIGDLKALFLASLFIKQELDDMKKGLKELEIVRSNRDTMEGVFMDDLNFINKEIEKCIKNLKS